MKEHPILFNGAMIRAILAGTKTQTRRVFTAKNGGVWPNRNDLPGMKQILRNCPYGQTGDRLWVRETHSIRVEPSQQNPAGLAWYRESNTGREWDILIRWRPSIHMPRWASRILLEIVSVRVERLQDISEADSIAEGINCYPFRPDDGFPICSGYTHETNDDRCMLWATAKLAYLKLWESINGPGSWDANPWVWVVEFKRVMP